jgi:hypothetical protein
MWRVGSVSEGKESVSGSVAGGACLTPLSPHPKQHLANSAVPPERGDHCGGKVNQGEPVSSATDQDERVE